ncbi:MAG: YebC/PmpR family DNA-binding transcriptional regulator [Planctomycetes bacterium]|jgi:YebC/PmpR family DNA-binding regulatory protein|nr:YebC/PmpR family DNA-binding transcriptional regulator [Planctomycetota bacterium]
MSGHSKWATTHRQKEIVDAKRGAIFTKIANTITIAARDKGGDPNTNFALRIAIERGRAANMPKDNIERAIKRGTGELAGVQVEELYYEGIGPANTQFIIKAITDSKNRSASNVRHIFSEHGGALGSVMWNFEQKGVIRIANEEVSKISFDDFELELIDQGASDIKREEEGIIIFSEVKNLQELKTFIESKGLKVEDAVIEYVAKEKQELNNEDKEKVLKLIEEFDDCEDISDYYTNANI